MRGEPQTWPEGFADGGSQRGAALILASLRGVSPRRLLALGCEMGTAKRTLSAFAEGRIGSDADRRIASTVTAADVVAACSACGARPIVVGDPGYPASLHDLADPPLAIFVRGGDLAPTATSVAVVGARQSSVRGTDLARALGSALAEVGITVVSGAARGIDAAAHLGALDVGGPTVAVLGSGIDVSYPRASGGLLRRIAEAGALVSEYPPGVPAEAFRFPARNRIIAALARALVVVEGEDGSGSLITADHALDLGRDVSAVPGAVTDVLAGATNALIREGARLVRGPDDLLADLGVVSALRADVPTTDEPPVSDETARVLAAVGRWDLPEAIARAADLDLRRVMAILVGLEVRGAVRASGGRYRPRALRGSGSLHPGSTVATSGRTADRPARSR